MDILKELEEKVELLLEKYRQAVSEIESLKKKLKEKEDNSWQKEREELIEKLESLLKKLEKAL
ncbi:MAG: DUF904 domain-containing protein [Thermoanaerobaculia bacterium]